MRLLLKVFKWIAALALCFFIALALLLLTMRLDHNRATTLPAPTGSFAVGRTNFDWRDPAHTDPMAPSPNTPRELLAWIWYPATTPPSPQPFADYLPTNWRTAEEKRRGPFINKILTRDLSRVHAHSYQDAPVSNAQSSFPVIFLRAGLAAQVADYTTLAEDLASHGYIVVGFDAPYRTSIVVFPDGRTFDRAPQNNADLLSGPQQEQLATRLVQTWSADTTFALDQLTQLNTSGRFQGHLDLTRVGAFGHSLGGATTLQFCHDDPRCKAGIDIDGAPLGKVIHDAPHQPFFFLLAQHHDSDSDAQQVLANIASIYNHLPSSGRLQLEIRGANHFFFSDDAALLKSPVARGIMHLLGISQIDSRRQLAITAHYVSTFFDVYLKGAPASALQDHSTYPEAQYQSTHTP